MCVCVCVCVYVCVTDCYILLLVTVYWICRLLDLSAIYRYVYKLVIAIAKCQRAKISPISAMPSNSSCEERREAIVFTGFVI